MLIIPFGVFFDDDLCVCVRWYSIHRSASGAPSLLNTNRTVRHVIIHSPHVWIELCAPGPPMSHIPISKHIHTHKKATAPIQAYKGHQHLPCWVTYKPLALSLFRFFFFSSLCWQTGLMQTRVFRCAFGIFFSCVFGLGFVCEAHSTTAAFTFHSPSSIRQAAAAAAAAAPSHFPCKLKRKKTICAFSHRVFDGCMRACCVSCRAV